MRIRLAVKIRKAHRLESSLSNFSPIDLSNCSFCVCAVLVYDIIIKGCRFPCVLQRSTHFVSFRASVLPSISWKNVVQLYYRAFRTVLQHMNVAKYHERIIVKPLFKG